jgi:outer membrane protein assembly factor BamA
MRERIIFYVLLALVITGCSETKYVPEDKYLLDRADLRCDEPARYISLTDMRPFIRQHGNSRWFSALKLPLKTYSLSGRDSTKWINRVLRNMGEPPELYDTLQTALSLQSLTAQMQNLGYLRASADVVVEQKGRKVRTHYILHPGVPYFLQNIDFDIQDTAIARLLSEIAPERRVLQKGMVFNADHLDQERTQITQYLVNRGYYRFNKDYITYKADSIEGTNRIDLTLVLHPYQDNQGTVKPHSVYTIGSVNFLSGNPDNPDIPLREKVLRRNTFLEVGDVYSARQLRNTYNHFGRLGIVRYTSINFHEHDDEPVLDCDINLSTNKSSTISFQPEGTNTAGDFGAAATVTFQNRNIFHGSENLSIELRGAYEAIKNLEGYGGGNYIEYSVGTKLTFPRFIAPFLSSSFRRRINATSELAANYDLQNRPEFHRRVFSVGWKYRWNDQGRHDRYQVDLLDLNYIYMPWISPTFEREYLDNASSRNAILRYNYENLFIMKFGVGYSYNNNRWAIRANVETAGNLLNWAARAMHFHVNEEGQYTFLNIAYAQYARGTFDFTRNINLDFNNQLVFHVGFGIAYPYGNSTILPFEKRYFSGGANSVRGWSVRSLGPGKFVGTDGRIDFINQTGDMKLDLNVEYRAKLFWKFSGALFIDAGNIWTLREYDEQPGGQFKFSEFFEQLAASYGLGVRLNFDFFIVRFDMGMKAVNPAYSDNVGHFPLLHPKFSRDFAFHFAVGLPF